jgi:hypothetical protein
MSATGFTSAQVIGSASSASSREDHGLDPVTGDQRGTTTLWAEDTS